MNIDITNLPVPKYKSKKIFSKRKTKYGRDEIQLKTVKYMDNLFHKDFLKSYFTLSSSKEKSISTPLSK